MSHVGKTTHIAPLVFVTHVTPWPPCHCSGKKSLTNSSVLRAPWALHRPSCGSKRDGTEWDFALGGQSSAADKKEAGWPISKLEGNNSACRGNLEHLLEEARDHSEHFIMCKSHWRRLKAQSSGSLEKNFLLHLTVASVYGEYMEELVCFVFNQAMVFPSANPADTIFHVGL